MFMHKTSELHFSGVPRGEARGANAPTEIFKFSKMPPPKLNPGYAPAFLCLEIERNVVSDRTALIRLCPSEMYRTKLRLEYRVIIDAARDACKIVYELDRRPLYSEINTTKACKTLSMAKFKPMYMPHGVERVRFSIL